MGPLVPPVTGEARPRMGGLWPRRIAHRPARRRAVADLTRVGSPPVEVREVRPEEYQRAGRVVVDAYLALPGEHWLPVPDVPLLAFRLALFRPGPGGTS